MDPKSQRFANQPESEKERLRLLCDYHIMDAGLEDHLNGLAHLASQICDTPISLINLAGEKHMVTKASEGWNIKELPRDVGLCSYTLQHGDIFEVPDVEEDQRFRNSPIVKANPDIQFYAGAPLRSEEGLPLGTISVMDTKPRQLSDPQKENLQLLADEAMSRLDKYRESQKLEKKNSRLEKISLFLKDSSDLQVIIDPDTLIIQDIITETSTVLGYQSGESIDKTFGEIIDDQETCDRIRNFLTQKKETSRQFDAPIKTKEGKIRYYELNFHLHDNLWYLTAKDKTETISYKNELNNRTRAIDASLDGIAILDHNFNIEYLNRAYAQKFSYESSCDLLDKNWYSHFGNDSIIKLKEEALPALKENRNWRGEIRGIRKDGTKFPVETSISYTPQNGYIAIIRDISSRKETERKLMHTLDNFQHAQELAKLANWEWEIGSEWMFWSDENYRIYGYDPDTTDPTLNNYLEIVHPEDIEKVKGVIHEIVDGHQPDSLRHRIITPQNELKHVLLRATSYETTENGVPILFGTTQDITDQIQAEEQLKKSLKEKEVLLQEIHHRVKNNLAVVSGLLQLEAFETENEELEYVLTKCQMRIQSMADIHENLYRNNDLSQVSFHRYMGDILRAIDQTYSQQSKAITIKTALDEVRLNINQAVPCGLIVNELVVNAFKHAFTEREEGIIQINLEARNNEILLQVQDNGVGLSEEFMLDNGGSLGVILIQTLCDQLDASLNIESENETLFEIRFDKKDIKGSSSSLSIH